MASGTKHKVADVGVPRRAPEGRAVPASSDDSWMRLLGQISPVAIFRGDADGSCIYANGRWCELSGLPIEAALGYGWLQALHPDDHDAVAREWARTCELGVPFRMEYRYLRPDGGIVWVLGQGLQERDSKGRLIGYIGTATDTTELHRMSEALERSRAELEARVTERTMDFERMALIVEGSSDAIISSDFSGRIVSWNPAAEFIFGYTAQEMIGQTTERLTPENLKPESVGLKALVRKGQRVEYFETVRLSRSGELIEVGLSIFPLYDGAGEVCGTSAIVRDIREIKKNERRLSQLSGRLLRLQDEERRRLARELHDSTTQSLAALNMKLSALNATAQLHPQKREALLAEGLALAKNIERELRTHTYLLHPPLLDERGLDAALHWLTDGFAVRSGISVDLDLEDLPSERLPEAVELAIFRVVQEGLSNIHRHSRSSTAGVHLRRDAGSMVLEIWDAGIGLPKNIDKIGGVGIAGMRERLAQIGGTLQMNSTKAGTTVSAKIPLS